MNLFGFIKNPVKEDEREPLVTFKIQRLSTERNKFLSKTIALLLV